MEGRRVCSIPSSSLTVTMTDAWAVVAAAGITTLGGLIGLAIKEFRNMKIKNTEDHGAVMQKLEKVQDSVDGVSERLNDHIDWHLKK